MKKRFEAGTQQVLLCLGAMAALSLCALSPAHADFIGTLNGRTADAALLGTSATTNVDGGTAVSGAGSQVLRVGSNQANVPAANDPGGPRNAELVFALPDFGAVSNPFTSAGNGTGGMNAQLNFFVTGVVGSPGFNGDLYGLAATRISPTPLAGDYFAGSLDTTNAVLLRDNVLLSGTTVAGALFTTATTLTDYLNALYANGAGANQNIFLRFSPDVGNPNAATNNIGYDIASANNTNIAGSAPTITFTSSVQPVPEPETWAMMGMGLGAIGLMMRRRKKEQRALSLAGCGLAI